MDACTCCLHFDPCFTVRTFIFWIRFILQKDLCQFYWNWQTDFYLLELNYIFWFSGNWNCFGPARVRTIWFWHSISVIRWRIKKRLRKVCSKRLSMKRMPPLSNPISFIQKNWFLLAFIVVRLTIFFIWKNISIIYFRTIGIFNFFNPSLSNFWIG